MAVQPGSWRHPEEATHEELIEMVNKLMVRNARMKKRAGESNRRADEMEQLVYKFRWHTRNAQQYLGIFRQQRAEGWLNRLAQILTKMGEL
jgi:hypothetical protein